MPSPLLRLLREEPEIRLQMIVANTSQLLRLLDDGKIDFAIVEGFFQKQFYESLPYRRERYIAVCSPGYPLPPSPPSSGRPSEGTTAYTGARFGHKRSPGKGP